MISTRVLMPHAKNNGLHRLSWVETPHHVMLWVLLREAANARCLPARPSAVLPLTLSGAAHQCGNPSHGASVARCVPGWVPQR